MPQKEFQIGLTMAGAISAGAYSAGVVDFLFQALEEWESVRQDPAVPNHRVGIKVMTGASAGAVTGAIAVVAAAQRFAQAPQQGAQYSVYVPTLHTAWVVQPCMVSPTGGIDLLSLEDLGKDAPVVSLLNATLLDQIAKTALSVGPTAPPRPYFAENLHVYITVSNLRGVPYQVQFQGGEHGMLSHGDHVHYVVTGVGSWPTASAYAETDPSIHLDAGTLTGPAGAAAEWGNFCESSLASAAFPAGLAPRQISIDWSLYDRRSWPVEPYPNANKISPVWPSSYGAPLKGSFKFLNVDGGMINNEPFDLAHFSLMETPPEGNPRGGAKADRAVVMIDPFPEDPDLLPEGKPDNNLISVLSALIPALKNQCRFKPSEAILAADEDTFSRFLVAPHRTLPGRQRQERYAIASGLLGGFGGFLTQAFREHDFQLGRRNCQMFLRESFALPDTNAIIQSWPQAARDDRRFQTTESGGQPQYTIIPLLGVAAVHVPMPAWPRIGENDLQTLQYRIKERFDAVTAAAVQGQFNSRKTRLVARIGLSFGKDTILDYIRLAILSDLVRRDQVQGWDIPQTWKKPAPAPVDPDDVRLVIAELLSPSSDFRTVTGIAASARLDSTVVSAVLAMCQAEAGKPYEVWSPSWNGPGGVLLYTLKSRRPSFLGRLWGTRQVGQWLNQPQVD